MLKRLVNWWRDRQLNKIINEIDLPFTGIHTPIIHAQEHHETYKIGEFTASVMVSKEELNDKLTLVKVNKEVYMNQTKDEAIQAWLTQGTLELDAHIEQPLQIIKRKLDNE